MKVRLKKSKQRDPSTTGQEPLAKAARTVEPLSGAGLKADGAILAIRDALNNAAPNGTGNGNRASSQPARVAKKPPQSDPPHCPETAPEVVEAQPELESSIRQRAKTLLADAAKKAGTGDGQLAEAAGAALESALYALFFESASLGDFSELRDRYRKKLTLLCLSVARAQDLPSVVASVGGGLDGFAEQVVRNDQLLLPEAAKQQRDAVRRRGIEEAFQSVGGTQRIGVCPLCKKQILPEWGDCYTHWGAACEKDNCCTCSPFDRADAAEGKLPAAAQQESSRGTRPPSSKRSAPPAAFPVFAPGSLF